MFIIYVTLAIKILNHQLIFPKNVINETVYLLSAEMHLNHSYKFKLIPMEFTSLKKKKYFAPNLLYHGNCYQMVSDRTKQSILEGWNIFSVKLYISTTFNVKMKDTCFPRMENKKKRKCAIV